MDLNNDAQMVHYNPYIVNISVRNLPKVAPDSPGKNFRNLTYVGWTNNAYNRMYGFQVFNIYTVY